MSRSLRIAYDARLAIGEYRGMGRFLRQLIAGRERDFIGLCADGEQDRSLALIASGSRPYPLWEQISLPSVLRKQKVDVFLAPYNTAPLHLPANLKLVLVVHDLIFMEKLPLSRSLYQNSGRLYRKLVVPTAVRHADRLVTVSHFTARELVSQFGIRQERIRVIHNSISEVWFNEQSIVVPAERYVLMVAGEAPSKNLARAIRAFAQCRDLEKDLGLRLKVVGVKSAFHHVFQNVAQECGAAGQIDFLGYIPDSELRSLYRNAALFVMPSLSEGFGIPVLEAMASGVPVAASGRTSLPEIGGDAALYFDPELIEQMANIMHEILSTPSLRDRMSESGRAQARKFHPSRIRLDIDAFWSELDTTFSAQKDKAVTQ